MKRCAMLLEKNPTTGREEYRIINNPTIGDIYSLRQKGAIILRQIVQRYGNEVHKTWVTDAGIPVVVSIDFLPCRCNHE